MHGVVPLAPAFDTVGCYGWSVADAVALYTAMRPAAAGTGKPWNLEIIRLEDPILDDCDPEGLAAIAAAAERLTDAGHRVRAASAPDPFRGLFDTQFMVAQHEAARIHERLREAPAGAVGPKMLEMIETGLAMSEDAYFDGRRRLAAARARFWETFDRADAILFPAAPGPAPKGLASTGDPKYIAPWTALGGPIVTQPLGRHSGGLPIAALLCGAPHTDLRFAGTAVALAEKLG
jgi:aspartyl-tRNA(Asn)/glutamyl-tRNA(Gln) amidotransferase subunit A